MSASENQIIVYQPNETVRLDVRLENETVWLTQARLGVLFGVDRTVVNRHIHNIYKTGELEESATCAKIAQVQNEGGRSITRIVSFYNLDMIIAVGYRVNSLQATRFRQWATRVLKEYLLRGYSVNARLSQLEDKVDRRLAKHERDIIELKNKVDFFVQTETLPLQGVFYDGQLWDARALVLKLIVSARRSLILIDNWATPETLDLFSKKRKGVNNVAIYQFPISSRGGGMMEQLETGNIEVGNTSTLATLNKCFGFTKMDAGEIEWMKKVAFGVEG